LLELADQFSARADVGFLFVGCGSDAIRLIASAQNRGLNNVLFFDDIHPDDISDLYALCHVGIVSLDPRHKSHNIPGKFLTYMQSGLSVLISPLIKLTLAVIDTAKVSGSFTPTD
jgi:sulfite reductase beta subunit-like hemoprotein